MQSIAQYKQLITSSLQRFSVHYGSILHLKINILIYIYKLISLPLFKPAKTRQEREKSLLSHPEVRSFTSRTSWFDTSKSLVSYTEVPCFKAHLDIARSSSPATQSLAPGLPPIQLDNRYQLMPASNPDRKGPSIPATRNA